MRLPEKQYEKLNKQYNTHIWKASQAWDKMVELLKLHYPGEMWTETPEQSWTKDNSEESLPEVTPDSLRSFIKWFVDDEEFANEEHE